MLTIMRIIIIHVFLLLVACAKATKTPTTTKIKNCTVEQYEDGALISCPDGSSATILNGTDGITGTAGVDAPTPTSVVIDCTIGELIYDEKEE